MDFEKDGDVSAGGVDHEARDGEGADALHAAFDEDAVLLFEGFDAADSGTDDDAAAVGIFLGEIESGIFDGGNGSGDSELAETIESFGFADVDAVAGDVEGGAFPADSDGVFAGVPTGDGRDAGLSVAEVLPKLIDGFAERCDDPKAG